MHLTVTGLNMFFENQIKSITNERTTILNDINFELKQGCITQIIGPSGCGKSTFLNILCGLLKPKSGDIFYGNQSIYSLSDSQLATLRNQKFGISLQKNIGIGSIPVIDNVNPIRSAYTIDAFGLWAEYPENPTENPTILHYPDEYPDTDSYSYRKIELLETADNSYIDIPMAVYRTNNPKSWVGRQKEKNRRQLLHDCSTITLRTRFCWPLLWLGN